VGLRVGRLRAATGTLANGEVAEVQPVVVNDLEHTWWYPSDTFNATRLFWDFFQRLGPLPP